MNNERISELQILILIEKVKCGYKRYEFSFEDEEAYMELKRLMEGCDE
tara:strand:+ start:587 stop:730 length:144 start_codon:yes stop_codon:yes gene_type:complete